MTRRCADSVTPANLPTGFPLYGAYDDGDYNNVTAVRAQHPGAVVIAITVTALDHFGDCLDVENGDATPAQAPGWVTARREQGHGGPLVYCAWANFPAVQAAFTAAKVAYPGFWVAGYPTPDGDAIPAGCVGHQWIDHGPWDESIFVDYLPGIDPTPIPTPTPTKETSMPTATELSNGSVVIPAVSTAGHLFLFQYTPGKPGTTATVIDLTDGVEANPPALVQP